MIKYQAENSKKDYAFRCGLRSGFNGSKHIHEHTEIVYVVSGTLTIFIDGKERKIPAGHLFFIFPNEIHRYTRRTGCKLWFSVFSNDFISAFFRTHPDMKPQNPLLELQDNRALIDALIATDPKDITRVSGLLLLLFGLLEKNTVFVQTAPAKDDLYNAVLGYIYRNFKNDITLADMAKELGYHEKYLSHALHSLTKKNFRSFLATYRVNHAKKLLRTTKMPIAEIALESGFSAINTFNRVFKEVTEKTPSEYRKKHH